MVASTPARNLRQHMTSCPTMIQLQLKKTSQDDASESGSTKCTCSTSTSHKRSSSKVNRVNNDEQLEINVNNSMKKKNKKNNLKRRVQFLPTCFVKNTISHHDMTDKEIQATWIQQKEEIAIRKQCQKLIATEYKNTKNNKETTHDMRGLENIKQRRSNRYIAREEVFDEQDRQDLQFDYDDTKLAFVYKTYTMKSTISARQMAIKDRNDIEQYIISSSSQ
jgi:hypothetical protein